jgi:hypothetical protein
MGGRAGTSTDGGSLAGLELSFGGADHGMDGGGRGGLNVTFAAASRASSEGDGGYQSADRSTTALLMDLIKREESEDGEQPGDAVGIKRVDLNAVCGAPVGDTGVKQCRLHWWKGSFGQKLGLFTFHYVHVTAVQLLRLSPVFCTRGDSCVQLLTGISGFTARALVLS